MPENGARNARPCYVLAFLGTIRFSVFCSRHPAVFHDDPLSWATGELPCEPRRRRQRILILDLRELSRGYFCRCLRNLVTCVPVVFAPFVCLFICFCRASGPDFFPGSTRRVCLHDWDFTNAFNVFPASRTQVSERFVFAIGALIKPSAFHSLPVERKQIIKGSNGRFYFCEPALIQWQRNRWLRVTRHDE